MLIEIEKATTTYLEAVDRVLPGFVTGLYLVGSATIGAWQPGFSDVDTIIFTARPAGADDLAKLAELHATTPGIDGVYVSPDQPWPTGKEPVPFVVRGEFKAGVPCGEATPYLWFMLAKYGIALRGPAVADLGVPVDFAAVRDYSLENLRDFWRATAVTFPAELAEVPAGEVMDAETTTFFVLGPARLHYTLAHRDIVSKSDAGRYLAQLFPEYTELADRAIRWRAGGDEQFSKEDLLVAGRAVIAVADDARRKFGPAS